MGKDDLETADDAEAELNGLMKPKFKRCDERGRTVQINDRTHMLLGSVAKLNFFASEKWKLHIFSEQSALYWLLTQFELLHSYTDYLIIRNLTSTFTFYVINVPIIYRITITGHDSNHFQSAVAILAL